jgi:predicted nucleic acid-binding protein
VPRRGPRPARGLLDTSAVIDAERLDVHDLPLEIAISTLTLAELTVGPLAATTAAERADRVDRLQRVSSVAHAIPFGINAALAYGRVYAAVAGAGRKARGARAVDLMIAATAVAEGLPLFTRNAGDFRGLETLLDVIAV